MRLFGILSYFLDWIINLIGKLRFSENNVYKPAVLDNL